MSVAWPVSRLKHGNKFTVCGGEHKHRSQAEARRCDQLRLLERVGDISALEQQPRFPCIINERKVCTYVADFAYIDHDGARVIEDVKGFSTAIYKLKIKIMAACYPDIEVTEFKA